MAVPVPRTIVLALGDAIARADVPALCERVRSVLEASDAAVLVCDVGAVVDADIGTVDVLARVQLTARRLGRLVTLRAASDDLLALLAFAGLSEVLLRSRLGLEASGQPEQWEQLLRPQEERELDDPAA